MTIPSSTDDDVAHPAPAGGTWRTLQPWVSLAARLGLAGIEIWAALPKALDMTASRVAVGAYDVLPASLVRVVAVLLPIGELAIGILLLVGLLTRYASAAFAVMLIVFIAGIAQAWARGLSIACGCFSGGGELPPGATAQYGWEIARDVGFIAVAVFLVVWNRSRFSLDSALGLLPPERTES
jgi:uncharacterized membrane protein YphA (DoxX/SURF4 family)